MVNWIDCIINFIENHNGFVSFLSVIFLVGLFVIDKILDKLKYVKKQKRLLNDLKFELEKINEDVIGHNKNFVEREENNFAFFPIKQINKEYYLREIDDTNFDTDDRVKEAGLDVKLDKSGIKEQISLVFDKIILMNNYLSYIMKDFNDGVLGEIKPIRDPTEDVGAFLDRKSTLKNRTDEEIQHLEGRPIYHYWKYHFILVMGHYEKIYKSLILKVQKECDKIEKLSFISKLKF